MVFFVVILCIGCVWNGDEWVWELIEWFGVMILLEWWEGIGLDEIKVVWFFWVINLS